VGLDYSYGESTDYGILIDVRLIQFDFACPYMRDEHKAWLESIIIPRMQRGATVYIVGLASKGVNTAYNQQLADKRATNVASYLVDVRGCDRSRVVPLKPRVETDADDDNDDPYDKVNDATYWMGADLRCYGGTLTTTTSSTLASDD
jgi:hypothetical protein